MYLLSISFLFLNFSTLPFNPFFFYLRHFLVLLKFLCDNCIHFIPEIDNFFYSHMYFELFSVITWGLFPNLSKNNMMGCLFLHGSHWHDLLAYFLQVGFHITIAIIIMYHIVIETWIFFLLLPFLNYSETYMIIWIGIFYQLIHSLWQITFRVEPLLNVQYIRIFSKSYSKKVTIVIRTFSSLIYRRIEE